MTLTKAFENIKFRIVNLISKYALLVAGIGFAFYPLAVRAADGKSGVVMFDFGPTTVIGEDQTNSPYHFADSTFEGVSWNKIEKSDVTSDLVYADGRPAAEVTMTWGISTPQAPTVINFLRKPTSSAPLGARLHRGVFANSSVGTDGVLSGQTSASNIAVGIKIGGLTAGNYEVYLIGFNTNQDPASAPASAFHVMAGGDETKLDYGALEPPVISANDTFSSWEEGHNYAKAKVSLRRGQFLFITVNGSGPSESRGCLNAVQIVPVP